MHINIRKILSKFPAALIDSFVKNYNKLKSFALH
jgi:hypothetical protein